MNRVIGFENLKKSINSFDVILCTTNSLFSTLINQSQNIVNGRGKYTHIAFCFKGDAFPDNSVFTNPKSGISFKMDKNETYLFESVTDTKLEAPNIFGEYVDGVQIRKFNDVFKKYFELKLEGIFTEIAWASMTPKYRAKFDYQPKEHNFNVVKKYLNAPYNSSVIDKLYVPFNWLTLMKATKYVKNYVYGQDIHTNGILCTALAGHVLNDFCFIGNIDPCTMLTEDFVYETVSAIANKFPKIYLEPLDIIE
jgi:hypothetical protein